MSASRTARGGEYSGEPGGGPTGRLPQLRAASPPARARLSDLESGPPPAPSIEMLPITRTTASQSLGRIRRFGLLAAIAFVGCVFLFGAGASIQGAIIANGRLVAKGGSKAVQHPTGGVLEAVLVGEGDRVERGEVVARLDARVLEAELLAAETELANQQARLARLIAERDGHRDIDVPLTTEFEVLSPSERLAIVLNEDQQLKLRAQARDGQRRRLRERIAQQEQLIAATGKLIEANDRELAVVEKELAGIRDLYERQLTPLQRLSAQERAFSQLQAQRIGLLNDVAAAEGRIAELELGIIEIDQGQSALVTDQISAARSTIAGLVQRRIVASRRLEDTAIRAPQAGTVSDPQVRVAGEVAGPGQVLMQVIPDEDGLVGEVNVRPTDIDSLYPGQPAKVTFSAFDRGTTPQVNGTLTFISPDLVVDPVTGVAHYKVRLEVDPTSLGRLGEVTLVPGMPVETFIQTNERTLLSYVTKPLADQLRRSAR